MAKQSQEFDHDTRRAIRLGNVESVSTPNYGTEDKEEWLSREMFVKRHFFLHKKLPECCPWLTFRLDIVVWSFVLDDVVIISSEIMTAQQFNKLMKAK